MRKKKWLLGLTVLLLFGLLAGVTIAAGDDFQWGVGSNINRGKVKLTLAASSLKLEAGDSQAVALEADPWEDEQLPGCEMAACPEKCGADCINADGDCTCMEGDSLQAYETEVEITSSDENVAYASFDGSDITIEAVGKGSASITVTASLREWTAAEKTIKVTVGGDGSVDQGSGSSSSGGSSGEEESPGDTTLRASLNKNGESTVSAAQLQKAEALKISGSVTLVFNKAALETIGLDKNLTVSAVKVEPAKLNADVQKLVGSRPVLEIKAASGGNAVADLGQGSLEVAIPYKVAADERAERLTVYSIDNNGQAVAVADAAYRADKKALVFHTNHLSCYAVGEKPLTATFRDVPVNHWAVEAVEYLVDKKVVEGKTATEFAPDDTITRAEFVTILAGAAKAQVKGLSTKSFSDVDAGAWYAPYVAWASQAGVAKGANGKFEPEAKVSRQEMAAMLYRLETDVLQKTLPDKLSLLNFADAASIAAYAKPAVKELQEAGVVGGKENLRFEPAAVATRAEAAKMVAALMQLDK